jgi:hypothetical protein
MTTSPSKSSRRCKVSDTHSVPSSPSLTNSPTDEQLSKREIQACSMLSHANIVSYRHNFRHDGLLHLVFDYVPDSMNKVRNPAETLSTGRLPKVRH